MEDLETGNQTAAAAGAADTNVAGETDNLSDIMGSMAQSKAPDATPDNEGNKAEGTEKSQAEAPAWTSQLPEEIRSNADVMKQLTKFGKIGELAKSYSELENKLGNSINLPGDTASEEEVNAFYQKIGKPDSAEKYSIEDKDAGAFKELAFKCNLTDAQAKAFYAEAKNLGAKVMQFSQDQLLEKARSTQDLLKKEYGNDYKTKMELCKRGVTTYGGKQLGMKLQETGLLYDIDVVKMFITLGEQAGEAGSVTKTATGNQQYKSTAEGGSFTFNGL